MEVNYAVTFLVARIYDLVVAGYDGADFGEIPGFTTNIAGGIFGYIPILVLRLSLGKS